MRQPGLAGYSAQDALVIARSAGFVDECTLDVLRARHGGG